MSTRIVEHKYVPREIFKNFHARPQRWAIDVVHRRGGKTVATINDTISRILYFQPPVIRGVQAREPGRFAYVAPYLNQARQIAWDYLKRYSLGLTKKVSEGELSITYFNDAKFTLYGADNPDAFRGQYFDGIDLDEYGMMRPSLWSEVLLPTLVDRRGWATFIGTPNGPNHFRRLVRTAMEEPDRWFYENWPVSKTKLIPQEELDEMKKMMLPEEYAQEMECSFEASARGAFYSAEIMKAEEEERIRPMAANRDMPLHFIYDLGYRDDTATICFQDAVDGYPIIHAEADNLRATEHYIRRIGELCGQYGCERGTVWLPHDAWAKTMQTGRSIMEQFLAAGIRPRRIPGLDVIDGIAAARMIFGEVYMNSLATGDLVEALKTYRRNWDEDKKAFSNAPVEDWSVHYADVFRYFAIVARRQLAPKEAPSVEPFNPTPPKFHNFNLEQLWEMQHGQKNGFIR